MTKVKIYTSDDCPHCDELHEDLDKNPPDGIEIEFVKITKDNINEALSKKILAVPAGEFPDGIVFGAEKIKEKINKLVNDINRR